MRRFLRLTCALAVTVFAAASSAANDDWPQFRGPQGQGHSDSTDVPVTWSEEEHVVWKTPIAGEGWSSPVVLGQQIWLTTALDDGHSLRAVCVDRDSGKIIHDVEVFHPETPIEKHAVNSYASPTPVLEPGRVYVHFGAMGTACLDTDTGDILWSTRELQLDHGVGPGGSPDVYRDLILLTCDGKDVRYVAALDKHNGQLVWKTPRSGVITASDEQKKAFCTPLVINVAGRDLAIMCGAGWVQAYDPLTGEEIWTAQHGGYSNVPRPLYGHGLIYICTGYDLPNLLAIRPDGRGDVTETHVVWRAKKAVPSKPSPILIDDLLVMVSDAGIATCLDARTGDEHWRQRLSGKFSASPVAAEGRIYLCNEDGKTFVLKAGKEFEQIAENLLMGRFMASPAIAGKAMFLRTDTHLYRIEDTR